jgi:hypothetical protein
MKVRYHLQKGPNYMHWQFKNSAGQVFYNNPKDGIIKLYNCILHNNRKLADKIYLGKNKDVCSWVKFKSMEFLSAGSNVPSWATHIRYNPRVLPYWHNVSGDNLDGKAFDELYLSEKGVFFDSCRNGVNVVTTWT